MEADEEEDKKGKEKENKVLLSLLPPPGFISLTSSFLSTHLLYISAQLQREERGVRSFLWKVLERGRKK